MGLRPLSEEWSREEVEKGRGGEAKGGQGVFCARKGDPPIFMLTLFFFTPLKLEPISIVLPGLLSSCLAQA